MTIQHTQKTANEEFDSRIAEITFYMQLDSQLARSAYPDAMHKPYIDNGVVKKNNNGQWGEINEAALKAYIAKLGYGSSQYSYKDPTIGDGSKAWLLFKQP